MISEINRLPQTTEQMLQAAVFGCSLVVFAFTVPKLCPKLSLGCVEICDKICPPDGVFFEDTQLVGDNNDLLDNNFYHDA